MKKLFTLFLSIPLTINVFAQCPDVQGSLPDTAVCQNMIDYEGKFTIADPFDGNTTYTIDGNWTPSFFDVGGLSVGNHELIATNTTFSPPCVLKDTANIEILAYTFSSIDIPNPTNALITDPSFTVTVTPIGGKFYNNLWMNSGPQPGIDSITGVFEPSVAGVGWHAIEYAYTAPNGCKSSDSSDIVVNAVTIIDEDEIEGFALFPNPTNADVQLHFNSVGVRTITVVDLNGKNIKSIRVESQNVSVDLSEFDSGMYFLKIDEGEVNKSIRVIKN